MTRARQLLVAALCLAALMLPRHYLDRVQPVNELSRLYLTQAIVDDRTLSIDGPSGRTGRVLDSAAARGHLYSDKAPGLAFLAVPAYAVFRLLGIPANQVRTHLIGLTLLLLAIPSVLLLPFVAQFAGTGRTSYALATAWLLASPVLLYSSLFFGHQAAALVLIAALACAARARDNPSAATLATSGALAALAALIELPCVLLAMVVAATALARRRFRLFDAVWFGIGALGPALILLGYNAACFGSPFALSYSQVAAPQFAALHERGLLGIGLPRPEVIPYWLWGGHRGLLPLAPWLGLAIVGVFRARRAARLYGLAFVIFMVVLSGFGKPSGGAAVGPRHLVPALPLLLPLCAAALERPFVRAIFPGLALAGAFFCWCFHSTSPYAMSTPYPLTEQALPMVLNAQFLPGNLGSPRLLVGLATLACALLACAVSLGKTDRRTFLGSLFALVVVLFWVTSLGDPQSSSAVAERQYWAWISGLSATPGPLAP